MRLDYYQLVYTICPFFLARGPIGPRARKKEAYGRPHAKKKGVCLKIKVDVLRVANLPHRNITAIVLTFVQTWGMSVLQVLETIGPPYSSEFVHLFMPMVENDEITGTMRGRR
ncbi:hypothetical protein NQ317_000775 [Molorchus minor]|uniref:Uncharacterized protein n=1 Tax=Molorchus minor TaxID=1323400 RepID=A0ABQ9J052_9CUCU|nr:hypothetical protein NQ317_000775 [Molorchus minor]